ncbi:MAG: hypothetical protein PHH14_05860 [Candidatus Margulisbacteria bacterium]|nr:hypothetical protein [Candidatus Margulisiibacteriota bacterium]
MNKKFLGMVLCLAILGVGLIFIAVGCGQSGSSPSTNSFTISGQVVGVTASGIRASATLPVTHIVAAGSNSEMYMATYDSATGTFSLSVDEGVPYAIGFYNKSGSTITLLGYLKQRDVDWDSLPLMNPSVDTSDLGTIEVDMTSEEATASIDVSSLISQMNMVDTTTAQYYGTVDTPMSVFTNVDADGNGEFDFQEGKTYLYSTFYNMGPGTSGGTGEIGNMLNGNYNDSYAPKPYSYGYVISAQGDNQAAGTSVTFTPPVPVVSTDNLSYSTVTSTVEADSSGGTIWSCFAKINGNPIISPEVASAGTHTVAVGSKTYTFRNFQGSDIIRVNSTDGIIYPVFNLVTNEAGYITTVNYKWKKLVSGAITNATAAEVKAAVEDTASSTAFVHTSPFISFFSDANTLIGSVYKFDRDGSSLDVSSYDIKLSELDHIQASYNLTSRIVCKFDLHW